MRLALALGLLVLGACAKPPAQAQAPVAPDAVYDLGQLLEGLRATGYEVRTTGFREYPRAMQQALPEEPLEKLLVWVDREGMLALRFSSLEPARQMEARYQGQGLRFGNWYLGGKVTVEVFERIKAALAKAGAEGAQLRP